MAGLFLVFYTGSHIISLDEHGTFLEEKRLILFLMTTNLEIYLFKQNVAVSAK